MSESSICFGKERCAGSLTCDDETTGSQSPWAKLVRRPRWVSWIITAQPYSWHSSTSFFSNDLVPKGVKVAERGRGIRGDDRRARSHVEGDAALRALDVVKSVAVFRQSILVVGRLVRGDHEPVLHRQMLEAERLKERIAG